MREIPEYVKIRDTEFTVGDYSELLSKFPREIKIGYIDESYYSNNGDGIIPPIEIDGKVVISDVDCSP